MSEVTVSPEVFLAMGREVLAKQPFSVLIGAKLAALAPGRCELHVPVTDAVKQQHGFVHGGVLSYAADNALTYAGGTALRVPVVTSEFKINYLRPAIGERHQAVATLMQSRADETLRERFRALGDLERILTRVALRSARPRDFSTLPRTARLLVDHLTAMTPHGAKA